MTDRRTLPVPDGLAGERLDAALARLFGLSRTVAADLVAGGHVWLDGADAPKSTRVSGGQWLDVELPPPPAPPREEPEPVPGMQVLHVDEDILVLDKPIGVAVHAAPGWTGPTVVAGLAATGYQLTLAGAAERQGIVHRLDAGTSGVMVVARSERAYAALKRAFRDREVDKTYHALVQGHPDPLRGTIDAPLDRHPREEYKWAVVESGKPSVTHYDTLEAFRFASLLEVKLETGRTHQIRVHMAAVKHPCVGDRMYGADPVLADRLGLQRQWLHAVRLGFVHPGSGRRVEYETGYPDDLRHALDVVTAES